MLNVKSKHGTLTVYFFEIGCKLRALGDEMQGAILLHFTDVDMPKCTKYVKNVHESINKGKVCRGAKKEQERFDRRM
jgi:hypothetical protein